MASLDLVGPQLLLEDCTHRSLRTDDSKAVRNLCSECFPINYPDSWYDYVVSNKVFSVGVFSRQQELVGMVIGEEQSLRHLEGEVGCVLDSAHQTSTVMYVISLGVCAGYRQRGVASFLMQSLMHHVSRIPTCDVIYLHVLSTNLSAIKLYKKLGYQELMTIPGYYHIQGRPADGYLYVYYLNNGRPFKGSCSSYLRRYLVETSLCQAAIHTYETAMQDDILSQENKAKARARYKADPEKKKASVRDSYKADPEKKKASVRDSYKADPEKKKASVRDSYKADPEKKKASVRDSYKAYPEKKKASVRDSYKADPEKKKASVRDSYKADPEKEEGLCTRSYNADIESKQSAKRQRYQEDVEENRAAKRQKYEDNSAAIKASERNRYWNDPAVRLAKRAAERKRYRRGHRTTTTTQSYSLYEPKSHALMEYNGGLEKAILRDSELLSEVNDAFCKSPHPLLAQKVVTRSASAAMEYARFFEEDLKDEVHPPTPLPFTQPCTAPATAARSSAPSATSSSSSTVPTASSSRAAVTSSSSRAAPAATSTSPTTGTNTSAPTTTLPAAPLAAATTTHMAPMATTRPPCE
ncbi:hypothetical protein EMCRGX_G008603 [Ephydatia muelleri]